MGWPGRKSGWGGLEGSRGGVAWGEVGMGWRGGSSSGRQSAQLSAQLQAKQSNLADVDQVGTEWECDGVGV